MAAEGILDADPGLETLVDRCLTQACCDGSGVLPGNYGLPMANGFPDTFCGTMTMALELGLEKYAEGVMDNWLNYCAPRTLHTYMQ